MGPKKMKAKPGKGKKVVRSVEIRRGKDLKGKPKGYMTSTNYEQDPKSMSYEPSSETPHDDFEGALSHMRQAFGEPAVNVAAAGKPSEPGNETEETGDQDEDEEEA